MENYKLAAPLSGWQLWFPPLKCCLRLQSKTDADSSLELAATPGITATVTSRVRGLIVTSANSKINCNFYMITCKYILNRLNCSKMLQLFPRVRRSKHALCKCCPEGGQLITERATYTRIRL